MTVADNLRKGATEKDAYVVIGGTEYELPTRKGTLGPGVVDVGSLYQDTGRFTYDPGFTSTAKLRVEDHVHRLRQGDSALSRLSDRTTRRAQHLS